MTLTVLCIFSKTFLFTKTQIDKIVLSYISLGLSILSVATLFYYEDNLSLYYQQKTNVKPTSERKKNNDVEEIIELNTNSVHSTNDDSENKISNNIPTLPKKMKQYGEFWKLLLIIWRYSEIVISYFLLNVYQVHNLDYKKEQ